MDELTTMSKGTDGKIAESHQNPRKCPEWSLPPSEESMTNEITVNNVAKGGIDCNSALKAATESGFFSDEGTNDMPSNSKSLSHGGGNGTSQCAAVAETPASSLQADSKQQAHETPSRPSSPEAPRSSHDSLVTGQWRSCQSNADQFIADVSDIIVDLDDTPSPGTMQWPRNDHVGRYISTPVGGLPDGKQLQVKHQSSESRPKKIQPKTDEELTTMSKETGGRMTKCHQNLRKCPEWSLPPSEETMTKEITVNNVAKGDIDYNSALKAATESGFFSTEGTNEMPSNSKSLSQCAAVAETPASNLQSDSKQQSHETPSRPTSPEAPRSSHDLLVTGQWRSCQSNADQFIADVTIVIEDLHDKPSPGTMQWPRNDHVGRYISTPAGTLPDGKQPQVKHQSSECRSKKIQPKQDKELTTMSKETGGKMTKCHQNPQKWPDWSLPPPEEHVKKETAVDSMAEREIDQNAALKAAAESGFSSAEGTNKMPSINSKSLSHDGENGTGQCENAAVAETPALSSLQADSKWQSHETPSRPTSPEAPCSSHDSLVTGQQRSCQRNAAVAGTQPSEDEEQHLTNIYRETGNPAEQHDDSENNGLLTQLQKTIESLQLNASFLVEELRKKTSFCASLRTNYQLQLEASRGECAQLRERVEELRRHLDHSAVLEDESQELIRMIREMYLWKEQECNRLGEELRVVVGAMQDLLQHREEHLRRERERLRLDSERRLEERLVDIRRAFDNAQTDKVKRLQQELAREKTKRKEIEEKSKTLLQETRRLRALPRQMNSKEEGSVTSGCSYEDNVSSHTASSEVESDEHPGSSSHIQQSDSDDSSDDELFEDARDEF